MAEKNSNEIDALYLSIHADGADKVKTQLNEVKAEAAKTGAAINQTMAEAPKAAAATGKSFDDLKSSMAAVQPTAMNVVATLQDLAAVAEKFYNIGRSIRMIIEDSERFARDVERMNVQAANIDTLDSQIRSGSRQYNAEATAGAGVNPEAMAMLDRELEAIRKQLYGSRTINPDGSVSTTEGLVNKQQRINAGGLAAVEIGDIATTAFSIGTINPYQRREDEIAELRKQQEALIRQRSQTGQRIGTASRGLQAATVERDQMQGALSAFSGATVFGDSAVLEKLDKLIELQQQQMNRPR